MASVSAVIIAKNEQESLKSCLDSVAWCDEIIVLDSGSEDDTVSIAEQAGAKVYFNTDWQGFGRQRQIAQGHAGCDWLFWIDADERVSQELAREIQRKVAQNQQQSVYLVPRLSWVFGRFIRHSGWYPDYVARLHARESTRYDDALVHEKLIIPDGMKVEKLCGDLLHYTYRDLHHYLVKSAQYARLWADQRQQRNKRSSLLQASVHALGCFIKMYFLRLGFLDGKQGFLLAILSSHSTFIKYADLWVRSQRPSNDD